MGGERGLAPGRGDRVPGLRRRAGAGAPSECLLRRDQDAVIAGLSRPWNSGQAEGQNTRVKRIKRDGYGRANFDLLRTRILHRS
ncbi:transposase [Streptomyces mirabilis]|uniref:transposase n=1 Tax=Streptomyces mirabilis TaxID=68239 RepID=UPI00368A5F22